MEQTMCEDPIGAWHLLSISKLHTINMAKLRMMHRGNLTYHSED